MARSTWHLPYGGFHRDGALHGQVRYLIITLSLALLLALCIEGKYRDMTYHFCSLNSIVVFPEVPILSPSFIKQVCITISISSDSSSSSIQRVYFWLSPSRDEGFSSKHLEMPERDLMRIGLVP